MESRQTREPAEKIELEVPLDTVCFLILKAREFDGKVGSSDSQATVLDGEDPRAAVLEDRPSDPVRKEMISLIQDLSEDQQLDLVTLMWLGRDDGGPGDWADLRQTAIQERTQQTSRYLVGTPLLGDYLEAGLDTLGMSCTEYNETSV